MKTDLYLRCRKSPLVYENVNQCFVIQLKQQYCKKMIWVDLLTKHVTIEETHQFDGYSDQTTTAAVVAPLAYLICHHIQSRLDNHEKVLSL